MFSLQDGIYINIVMTNHTHLLTAMCSVCTCMSSEVITMHTKLCIQRGYIDTATCKQVHLPTSGSVSQEDDSCVCVRPKCSLHYVFVSFNDCLTMFIDVLVGGTT